MRHLLSMWNTIGVVEDNQRPQYDEEGADADMRQPKQQPRFSQVENCGVRDVMYPMYPTLIVTSQWFHCCVVVKKALLVCEESILKSSKEHTGMGPNGPQGMLP